MECFQFSQELYSSYNKLIGIDCFLFIALVEVCIIRIIMHKFNYKSISLEAFINSLLFALISILFILKDVCVLFAICLIVLFVVLMMCRIFECLWEIIKILKIISLVCTLFLVGSMLYIIIDIMLHVFNNGSIYFNKDSFVSTDIGDWGDFATFFGGFFTLISIYLAYRAFISQMNASRRASFDATFTQIFAQHKALHDKAVKHKIYIGFWNKHICNITNKSRNVFSACREEYEIRQISMSVKEFWEHFNRKIELEASIDFKNYFKYIYHEVSIVIRQPDDILDGETKFRYIQLIQAQMNYDELICYLINQIEYISRYKKRLDDNKNELKNKINQEFFNEAKWYANNLREYKFFRELCKNGCGYSGYISILMKKEKKIIEELISADWVCTEE